MAIFMDQASPVQRPTTRRVSSCPPAELRARLPARTTAPLAVTTSRSSTFWRRVPLRMALVPLARVAHMRPRDASAPGSLGKKQAAAFQGIVELLASHAGLVREREVFGVNGQDVVHAPQVNADATLHSQ